MTLTLTRAVTFIDAGSLPTLSETEALGLNVSNIREPEDLLLHTRLREELENIAIGRDTLPGEWCANAQEFYPAWDEIEAYEPAAAAFLLGIAEETLMKLLRLIETTELHREWSVHWHEDDTFTLIYEPY